MTDAENPDSPTRPAVAAGGDARLDSPRTDPAVERERALRREREQFSGMRFWLAFFGWLTATGMTVVLLALVAAVGALFRAQNLLGLQQGVQALGIAGASECGGHAAFPAVRFSPYSGGEWFAGRMPLFRGQNRGLADLSCAVSLA